MKNSFTDEQLELFAVTYGNDLARSVASTDPASFATRVPSTWLDLVAHPRAPEVRALWEPAVAQLPRFVEYLAHSVTGAAIFEAHGFPVLAMALPDWNEEDCELKPGFCWMGTPTASEQIERLITEVGPIPASLEQLWRVANFIDTKEHSILCSLDARTRAVTEAPVVLPPLANVEEPEGAYECLQIAVVNDQMVTCMTRLPGQPAWNDLLVRRFHRTGQVARPIRKRLDDVLTDWSFSDWSL
jgi:hypothetical protein